MDRPDLDALLTKHRLSFHWNAAGKTWFLIGQFKGGNALHSTKLQNAEDIEDAKTNAIGFIIEHFQPHQQPSVE